MVLNAITQRFGMQMLAVGLLSSGLVLADQITVNELGDNSANGLCSIRDAISSANTDSAVDGCTAGNGADEIIIPPGSYDLSLAGASENANVTGDLDIASDITIRGHRASDTSLSAGQIDRLFHLVASDITVVIDRLTLTLGRAPSGEHGGAILMGDTGSALSNITLTVQDSIVSSSSTVGSADDGGAIASKRIGSPDCLDCTVNISGSTITGNLSADRGGAIYNNGNQLTITNSTISGNTSVDDGGGLETTGSFNSFVCNNCTIVDNTSGENGGGVDMGSVAPKIFHNSIVANNSSGDAANADCEGTSDITINYSLLEASGGCTFAGSNNELGSDPDIGPLADNGGKGTTTHALNMASPAIDTGELSGMGGCLAHDGSTIDRDQRLALRAMGAGQGGSGCDMGAYEFDSPGTPVELQHFSIE